MPNKNEAEARTTARRALELENQVDALIYALVAIAQSNLAIVEEMQLQGTSLE